MTALNESSPNRNLEQGTTLSRQIPTGSTYDGSPALPGSAASLGDRVMLETLVALSLQLRLRGVDLESSTGLSGRELDLVALLTASGPTSVKSLVVDLNLPRSTMTAIVDRLEERGLVTRTPNPNDRRSVVLEATPTASQALLRYREGVLGFVGHIKKVLNDGDQADFTRMIQRLSEAL